MTFITQYAFADTTTPATSGGTISPSVANAPLAPSQPSMMGMLPPFILMIGVFYFLMIRPQQKQVKQQEDMVNKLQKGEEVITKSGIIGRIHGIADKFVTLEVDKNVHLKILKSQVDMVLRGEQKA